MADKDADLKIGADTSQAEAQFEKMAQSAMTAGQRIQSEMRAAGQSMTEAIVPHLSSIQSEFAKIEGVVKNVTGAMMAFSAVVAGGAVFKSMVDESVKITKEATSMGKAMGMSATQASILNVALGDNYISSDTMLGANQRLTKTLKDNEQAFGDLGVKTRDSNGNLRSSMDIMLDTNKALLEFREGVDRNIEGQKIYGKGWGEVSGVLKLTRESLEEASSKAKELGLIVGTENVEATKAYRASMNDVGDVIDAVKKTIGDALLPALTQLGNWFSDAGPTAVTIIKGAIGGLMSVFWGLREVVGIVWETIAAMIEVLVGRILQFADVAAHAFRLDFSGAKAAWENGTKYIEDTVSKRMENIVKLSEETRDKMYNLFANPTDTPEKSGGKRSNGGASSADSAKVGAEKSRMSEWETELAQAKVFYQKTYDLKEYSKQQEREYWDSILRNVNTSGQEKIAIGRKIAELDLEILKKSAQQKKALSDQEISEREKSALDQVSMQEGEAQRILSLGEINKSQMLALQQQYEDQRFQIQIAAQEARIQALKGDPNEDPVALQKALDQLEDIRRKHGMSMQKLQTQQVQASKEEWLQMFQPVTNAIEKSVTGMIMGTLTLRKAMSNIFQGILGEFVSMTAKMAANWIATELAKTGASKAWAGIRTALFGAEAGEATAAKTGEATAVISANAGEAASGAAASQAAIPFAGPALAAAAFAGTMAMVLGAKSLLSARGGFDIPAGINPLTQLHEKEMVLPAAQADVIRNMAAGGGSGGGDTHFHVHALDAQDVQRFFKRNSHTLAPGLRQLARNFSYNSKG